MYANEETKD